MWVSSIRAGPDSSCTQLTTDRPSRLIAEVKRRAIGLVVLDPLRSVTGCVDQGPADLQPFDPAAFARDLTED